jgi:hypothetical protein
MRFANQHGWHIKRIRYDAGSVENAEELTSFLSASLIHPSPAATEAQYQNPVERFVRALKDNMAAMMFSQKALLPSFWGLCFLMAIQARNLSPNSVSPQSQPPVLSVMGLLVDIPKNATHYFGELVVIKKTGPKVSVPHTRNELARIVGYGNFSTGSWLLAPGYVFDFVKDILSW